MYEISSEESLSSWPTATPPAGWLQCNGATFTKEQYPVLARVYPTLRLPDLRGE
ncbi:phage tail protein, partial [Escherichia coli]|uniref:phage tail protein n=1 Tax=Escherichia coli TaxID=562 RepID=UPI003EE0F521